MKHLLDEMSREELEQQHSPARHSTSIHDTSGRPNHSTNPMLNMFSIDEEGEEDFELDDRFMFKLM